jgi:TRAP-type transport system periplasmic protein
VKKNTGGEVLLDVRYAYGDELRMVSDMRNGQLDGAALTAIGLAQIYPDALLFQLPGLFATWSKLEGARKAMKVELDAELASRGFTVLGWGDVGAAKIMSNGFEVRTPNDLRGKNAYVMAGDPIGPMFYSRLRETPPKQVALMEILPALGNGTINVLLSPALAAEQLQWSSRVTHLNTMTVGFGVGATVVTTAKYTQIAEERRKEWAARGSVAGDQISQAVRHADAQAFARLKSRKIVCEPTEAERGEWRRLFAETRTQLRGTSFTASTYDKIVRLAQ